MDHLNYQMLTFWWNILLTVGMIAVGLYAWWKDRNQVTRDAINDLDHRVDETEDNIVRINERLLAMPNIEAIASLHQRMDSLNREMGELSGQLTSTNKLLNTLHNHQLQKESRL